MLQILYILYLIVILVANRFHCVYFT